MSTHLMSRHVAFDREHRLQVLSAMLCPDSTLLTADGR